MAASWLISQAVARGQESSAGVRPGWRQPSAGQERPLVFLAGHQSLQDGGSFNRSLRRRSIQQAFTVFSFCTRHFGIWDSVAGNTSRGPSPLGACG